MLRMQGVSKVYRTTEVETRALDEVCLEIRPGEFVAIMGPSGCGKSTLLNIVGMLDSPSTGRYFFFDREVSEYTEKQLTQVRRAGIGFIFQSFNLIDDLSIFENVEVALLYRGLAAAERRKRITAALDRVGIGHRSRHLPAQLSGGQQQRAAIARALVSQPKLILADEPTGNLDTPNGAAVMDLLTALARSGTTVVMVTHSSAHAALADRIIHLLDGRTVAPASAAA